MASDSLGADQWFRSDQTRGVGTECVGTKRAGTKIAAPSKYIAQNPRNA